MSVVGVDFGEPLFRGASEVHRVGSAEIGFARGPGQDGIKQLGRSSSERKEGYQAALVIITNLISDFLTRFVREPGFPAFAQEDGCQLCPGMSG